MRKIKQKKFYFPKLFILLFFMDVPSKELVITIEVIDNGKISILKERTTDSSNRDINDIIEDIAKKNFVTEAIKAHRIIPAHKPLQLKKTGRDGKSWPTITFSCAQSSTFSVTTTIIEIKNNRKLWFELNIEEKQAFADWGGYTFTTNETDSTEVILDEKQKQFTQSGLKRALKYYQRSQKLLKNKKLKKLKKLKNKIQQQMYNENDCNHNKRKLNEIEVKYEEKAIESKPEMKSKFIPPPIKKYRLLRGKRFRNHVQQKLDKNMDNIHIAIDCSFDHLMNNYQVKSVATQIRQLYGMNMRAQMPCKLYVTSFYGRLKEYILKGFQHPSCFDSFCFTVDSKSLEEYFVSKKANDMIYLTPDCETDLESLESSKVYVIGGLVDRNIHKSYTAELAQKYGYQMRRLPIEKYMTWEVGKKKSFVLTINHVFTILIAYANFHDWRKALAFAVPERKCCILKEPLTVTEMAELKFEGNLVPKYKENNER